MILGRGRRIETVEDFRVRDRQLRALADLGECAIRASDLTQLLEYAIRAAAEILDTDRGVILQTQPDDDRLLVRAAANGHADLVGRHASSVADLDMRDALEIPIQGATKPWGLLAVQCGRPESFSADELEFLRSVANILSLAIARNDDRPEWEVLQTIFDHIPVMISFWDRAGRLRSVNREWEKMFGWTAAEAAEFFIVPYSDPEARSDEGQWTDLLLRTRSGHTLDTTWARFALSDGSSMGFGINLTERKSTERALIDSELRFAKAFQVSPVALAISTVDEGRILDVNDTWLGIFGYRRDEVIGRTNAELRISAEPTSRAGLVRRIRGQGTVRNLEAKVRVKSGEVRDLMVSALEVNLAGQGESWLSALLDITDRKRAEEERDRLLESEKAARAAAESALERLRAIESITDSALQNLELDELLQKLLALLRGALRADFVAIGLVDEKREEVYVRAVDSDTDSTPPNIRAPLGHGVSAKIAQDGQPRIVNDLATVDLSRVIGATPEQILAVRRSVMGAPLKVGDKVVGVVTAASREPDRFHDEDLKLLLVVADRVAPVIERGRLTETVHAARERLQALSARLLNAQEEERRRLAVELHDELGQVLTAVKINLHSLERTVPRSRTDDLTQAIASVDRAMERVRDLALALRPSVLDDLGLPAALRWYGDRFARDTAIDVHFSIDATIALEPTVETACFRVAQEALTNVARHAHARGVCVDLHPVAGGTELRVRDDGIGFDVAAARRRAVGGASLGLMGMEERVSLLGGAFDVQSTLGAGTEVSAVFPFGGKE